MPKKPHGLEGTPLGDFINKHGDEIIEEKVVVNASGQNITTRKYRDGSEDTRIDQLEKNDDIEDLYGRKFESRKAQVGKGVQPEASRGQIEKAHREAIKEDVARTREKVMKELRKKHFGDIE